MAHSQWGGSSQQGVCTVSPAIQLTHACTPMSGRPLAQISGLEHTPTTGVHTRCVAPLWREGCKEETHRGHAKAIWARIHESQILRASRKGDVLWEGTFRGSRRCLNLCLRRLLTPGVEHGCRMDRTRPSEVQSSEKGLLLLRSPCSTDVRSHRGYR